MSRWLVRVDRLFASRTELANLALFVSLFCAGIVIQTAVRFPEQLRFLARRAAFDDALALVPPYLQHPPLLGWVEIPELGAFSFALAGLVLGAALLGAALGVRARWMLAIALVAYFVYFAQIFELGYVRRKTNLIPFILLILLATPDLRLCRPAVWIGALRGRPIAATTAAWPLALVRFVLAWAYFSAGLAKLRNTGVSWANGDVLQANLLERALQADLPLALWMAGQPALCQLASIGTLVFELGFWTVLLVPRFGPLYALAGIAFHLGIQLTMGIHYLTYWGFAYLVFLDVRSIRWIARRLPLRGTADGRKAGAMR